MLISFHAGDAYFDLDAAQFLLEELQHQRRVAAAASGAVGADRRQQQEGTQQQGSDALASNGQQAEQQQQSQDEQQHSGDAPAGSSGVLGHAVGPRWVQQLPAGAGAGQNGGSSGLGSVELEYGAEISAIQFAPADGSQGQQQQQPEQRGAGTACGAAGGAAGAAGAAREGPWADRLLLLTLTNGRQLEADLVLLAIGVRPALEWVPPCLERAADGGLRVNRCGRAAVEGTAGGGGGDAVCGLRWHGLLVVARPVLARPPSTCQ